MDEYLLEIKGLSITFTRYERGLRQIRLKVIRSLEVAVRRGEIVAVVGASGSGKSLLAHALLGILPPNGEVQGSIKYQGEELDRRRIAALRGQEIALVPQGVTSLDPLKKAGALVRNGDTRGSAYTKLSALFARYDLCKRSESLYPFELSGGMSRRVILSAAMWNSPALLVADEPTPGLHPEAAHKVMGYFREAASAGNGVLLITHDISLALEYAHRVAVFYAGTTVEDAPAGDFAAEETLRHPYTKALWRAFPQNGFCPTPGTQPLPGTLETGCPYRERCEQGRAVCQGEIPLQTVRRGTVRCTLPFTEP